MIVEFGSRFKIKFVSPYFSNVLSATLLVGEGNVRVLYDIER